MPPEIEKAPARPPICPWQGFQRMAPDSADALALANRLFAGEIQAEGPTPSRFWGDQWLRVSEKVLKGLNHKLTNRVAAIESVVAVLEPDGSSDPELVAALASEVAKLHELLTLFRLMPAEPFATAEPVRLQDVIPQMLRLHLHHADLKEIPFDVHEDQSAQPVLVRQSALLRCLLVLLESVAGNALRSQAAAPLRVTYAQRGNYLEITFEGPAPRGQLIFSGDGSLIHAARAALAHAHAEVEGLATPGAEFDMVRYEIRLPALAEARRLERNNDG